MKDLKVVNLKALGKNEENYAIVCSGFSMRHSYSTAKALVQRLKALECPEIVNLPTICGTKDDSWLMVNVKEVQVHLILEEYREELDLEFRWMNPPPPEMRKKWDIYKKLKRKG
jgi:ribosomal silencing factor RsfS